ncbi:hypothetical protein [Pontibacter harenae]|uniref:hypothetical protein n=1 Tax=Pontibacter harenae TaxID=2894083 RepID=UPI001E288C19|nr:hypothetical protein [Pontibacter harenae]MCC9167467.1 hypothetical protein [Pontibacter harenae]
MVHLLLQPHLLYEKALLPLTRTESAKVAKMQQASSYILFHQYQASYDLEEALTTKFKN